MSYKMNTNLLITDSDLDGIGCAVLMNIFYPNNHTQFCTPRNVEEYFETVYKDQNIDNYNNIFITDLSLRNKYPTVCIGSYNTEVGYMKVRLFDHHKTAEFLNSYDWATVTVQYPDGRHASGTSLFWDFLMTEHEDTINALSDDTIFKIHRFVELVRLWDTFEWKTSPLAKDAVGLKYLLDIYRRKDLIYNMVANIMTEDSPLFSDEDRNMMKFMQMRKDKYIDYKMKQIQMIKYDEYNVAFVFAEDFNSELGNLICVENEDVDFAAIVSVDNGTVSLRSVKDNVDVSLIAKRFDGGGHFHAAGFPLKEELIMNIRENIFTK